jgi:hypothetical protein
METPKFDSWVHILSILSTKNPQVTDSATAVENLVPYSTSKPEIFKSNQLLPVRDLKVLVRDYKVSSPMVAIKGKHRN